MNVKIISVTSNPIETIYRAYRVCYAKDIPTEIKIPTMETSIGDIPDTEKMIDFIKSHAAHESPLEHVNITFAIEGVSRSLSHQLVRHRLASYSQQSQRYVNGNNFSYVTPKTVLQHNKWRSVHIEDVNGGIDVNMDYEDMINTIFNMYNALLVDDIPKEDARYILPNATTTNLICTMNLREFRHFIDERACIHAQWEIRDLAFEMLKEVKKVLPFADYKARKCGATCFECVNGREVNNG